MELSTILVCLFIGSVIGVWIWQIIHDEVSSTLTQKEIDDMSYTEDKK